MSTASATVTLDPRLSSAATQYVAKLPAMSNADLVAAHARISGQVATMPISHPLWDSTCATQEAVAAELMRRLG